jgi:hypothetical protein
VEILRNEDSSIEIKPKGYLGKKNWREINEILLRNGFECYHQEKIVVGSR